MPVIVRQENWEQWFSDGELSDDIFQRITAPYSADEMSALAVSNFVNSARVDDARCVEPLPPSLGGFECVDIIGNGSIFNWLLRIPEHPYGQKSPGLFCWGGGCDGTGVQCG
jgi:hypothetical protein